MPTKEMTTHEKLVEAGKKGAAARKRNQQSGTKGGAAGSGALKLTNMPRGGNLGTGGTRTQGTSATGRAKGAGAGTSTGTGTRTRSTAGAGATGQSQGAWKGGAITAQQRPMLQGVVYNTAQLQFEALQLDHCLRIGDYAQAQLHLQAFGIILPQINQVLQQFPQMRIRQAQGAGT